VTGIDGNATPGPAFCTAVGAAPGVRSVRRLLHLDRIEPGRHDRLLTEAWDRGIGYSLLRWTGPAPDGLAAEVAAIEASMNDAPMDGLDYGDEQWSEARLREVERNAADTALRLYQVGVRHDATGELARLTRIAVVEEDPPWAYQWDTVVVAANRGHRPGLVVKLEMLRWLADAQPALTTVETDNAGSNRHMIAVNEASGFEPADSLIAYQLSTELRSATGRRQLTSPPTPQTTSTVPSSRSIRHGSSASKSTNPTKKPTCSP